jgi:succinate dehydrogenase/fumarate reductase flavoprotein subunit
MSPAPAGAEAVYDVVVVGGGGSGLAAAIEARSTGRSVALVEKNPALGGSTAWSIGSISASSTPHQLAKGIQDSPADHWRDMAGFNGDLDPRDNRDLRRVLADAMPDTFRWLLSHGIRFYGPMPEPPHKKPRMHNVLPNSRSFIAHLGRAARRAGVDIVCSTRAVALSSEAGRVDGIDCETPAGKRRFTARGGVVLASGDFTSDPELKGQFMGPQQAKIDGVNITATGDGQKLALPLGARILNGDLALGPELRFVPPQKPNLLLKLPPWPALANLMAWSLEHMPSAILRPFVMSFVTTALAPSLTLFTEGAILVNKRGERFAPETDAPAFALPDQPDKVAYILLDARMAGKFSAWPNFISTAPGVAYAYVDDYRRNRPDVFKTAATLDDLATKLAMPAGSLSRAVAQHNSSAGNRPKLEAGPYVTLGPVRAVFVHAEGGLGVDAEHRVLGADDQPIPGLYAAGSTGQGGLLLKGHGHHLAWAFASGRRAGRNAAFRATTPDTVG